MAKHVVFFRYSTSLIVAITILLTACKSRRTNANDRTLQGLDTKFERLYIEACTQSIIGNYSVSLAQFSKCIDLKPEEASVYYQISKIRQVQNEEHAAFQNALKANALAPSNKFYAMHYAILLRKNGELSKAENVLETAFNANPADENLCKSLDGVLELQNKTDKRIALWNKYRRTTGLKVSTGVQLISLYRMKKDYTSAHLLYDELKKAAPGKVRFYIEDAKLYEEQKDIANANLNYEKAMAINPNNWDVNYALYQYHSGKGDTAKALIYFTAAFEKSITGFETKFPACQQLLKTLKNNTRQCNLAGIAADNIAAMHATDARALFTAAELYAGCYKYQSALAAYTGAARLNPNQFDAWTGAMKCGIELKQYDAVMQTGEKALEYFPNTALVYVYFSKAANLNKDYAKAYEMAENGERVAFDDTIRSNLMLQKGISLLNRKKYTEARPILESAIAINSTDPELYECLGNVMQQLNDNAKASELLRKAEQLRSKKTISK